MTVGLVTPRACASRTAEGELGVLPAAPERKERGGALRALGLSHLINPHDDASGEECYVLDSDEEAGAQRDLMHRSRSHHLTNGRSRFQHALPFTAHWDLSSRKSRRFAPSSPVSPRFPSLSSCEL